MSVRLQLSLRELLFAVAIAAGFSTCLSVMGFTNAAAWSALMISFVLSTLFVCVHSRVPSSVFAVFMLVSCVGGFVVVGVNGLLHLLANLVIRNKTFEKRTAIYVTTVCTLAAFAFASYLGYSRGQAIVRLQRKYPLIDVASRLKHEQQKEIVLPLVGPKVEENLQTLEYSVAGGHSRWRRIKLQRLHDNHYVAFLRAGGFGISRMPSVFHEHGLQTQPLRDLTLFDAQVPDKENPASWRRFHIRDRAIAHDSASKHLHWIALTDFVNPMAFGAKVRDQHAGFVPHAFHYSPNALQREQQKEEPEWVVTKLELISLHRFGKPTVYVSETLPRMDQLNGSDVPRRPLNAFERRHLAEIWNSDNDIIVDESQKPVRMLGAIRAVDECLACHTGNRGEVLGAFTYQLRRLRERPL